MGLKGEEGPGPMEDCLVPMEGIRLGPTQGHIAELVGFRAKEGKDPGPIVSRVEGSESQGGSCEGSGCGYMVTS